MLEPMARLYSVLFHRSTVPTGLRCLWRRSYLVAVWLLSIALSQSACEAKFASFSGPPRQGDVFTTLLVHRNTGDVYIGGKNYIWQLNRNLTNGRQLRRGTVNDSSVCGPPPLSVCDDVPQYREQHNFILALHADYSARQRLIACGTVYRGACEIIPLGDITKAPASITSGTFFPRQHGFVIPPILTAPFLVASSMSKDFDKLFIATPSFSGDGIRNPILRTLSTATLQLATNYSQMLIKNSGRDFPSAWVASFRHHHYVYFVYTEQVDGEKAKPSTTLVRLCEKDGGYSKDIFRYKGFGSYVEMEYGYFGNGKASGTYAQAVTLVGAGGLLARDPEIAYLGGSHSVVVTAFDESTHGGSLISVVPLQVVDNRMTRREEQCESQVDNIQAGTDTVGSFGMQDCKGFHTENASSQVCGHEQHLPLAVPQMDLNYSSQVLALGPALRVRSLVGAKYAKHTVVFAGTANGRVLKILVNSFGQNEGRQFDNIEADTKGRPIVKLVFSPNKDYVYAMANATGSGGTPSSEIIKVPVFGCERYTSCSACTSPQSYNGESVVNPLCGWCVYTGKCTSRTECQAVPNAILTFHQNSSVCAAIQSVTPTPIPQQKPTKIFIDVTNLPLPPAGSNYYCWFGNDGGDRTVAAHYETTTDGYTCTVPSFTFNHGIVNIPFGLRLNANGPVFLSYGHLNGFNCGVHSRCQDCVSTMAPCLWCSYSNLCTTSQRECSGDHIIQRVNTSSVCPSTKQLHEVQPLQGSRQFQIEARNLMQPRPGTRDLYQCALMSPGSAYDVVMQASLGPVNGDSRIITCERTPFSSAQLLDSNSVGWQEKHLVLLWNGMNLSGGNSTRVAFYNCEMLSKRDCSLCIAQLDVPQHYPPSKRFQCRWCAASSECRVDASCSAVSRTCPGPELTGIFPRSGPVKGGTRVTVNGTNIGSRREDLSGVLVSDVECNVVSYTPARGLECTTSRKFATTYTPGSVIVTLYNRAKSSPANAVEYNYTVPRFSGISPAKAPMAGGTLITLSGSDFDTGRDVRVSLAGVPCTLASPACHWPASLCSHAPTSPRNGSQIQCYASPFTGQPTPAGIASGSIEITIDGTVLDNPQLAFTYHRNPVFAEDSISPSRGIVGGGIEITVRGDRFSSVRDMGLVLRTSPSPNSNITENATMCVWHGNTTARCPMPPFPSATPYGNVILFHDGQETLLARNFDIKENPQPESSPVAYDELLHISGVNLDFVDKTEYRVTVGTAEDTCHVSSVEQSNLFCKIPPSLKSGPGDDQEVTVHIGRNLHFNVGRVQFQDQPSESQSNVTTMAGAVAGGAAFLLTIFLVLFLYCRKKAMVAENEVSRLIARMETEESRVAMECRSAFTALMTDLGDHGVSTAEENLPYLSFHQYAMRSMFPSAGADHPILQPLGQRLQHLAPGRLEHTKQTLATFQRSLAYNKKFMVTFVHALETHFSLQDRVAFASLLMVALHDKMEYATEVLKCLLADLIKSSVQKSHPKLLLRRMDSVAEKLLSNWLTFCLYDYIRTQAGRPLYMLFKAVKTQTERGPCDAFTGEAKFSLSEEKLLREAVDFEEITCTFKREKSAFSVRLVDCDTITQAKEKIMDAMYKTAPVSTRPDLASVDLVMDGERGAHILMRDEDVSTVQEGNLKKVNTLYHYGVKNGAVLQFMKAGGASSSGKSERSDYINNVVFSPTQLSMPIIYDGAKPYHLVKQAEFELPPEQRQTQKMVHEIFLTRLLFFKNVLQRFVHDLFCKVFSIGSASRTPPPVPEAVKYLFDFLDQQATENGIDDPDVVHMWKNNSVPLRFWINIIKNPDFVFDIHKSATVDSSLSVVAQMVMDSCGTSDQRLTIYSPTTKLLYAREVKSYRTLVEKYYAEIQAMPVILEGRMHDILQQVSVGPGRDGFQKESAMYDVFIYGLHYRDTVSAALKAEGHTDLLRQFEEVCHELAHGFDEHASAM